MQLLLFILAVYCPFSLLHADWVSDKMEKMTLDEKIGQLLIVGTYPNQEEAQFEGQNEHRTEYVEKMILDYHIGGILFKYYWYRPFGVSWDPVSLATQVNHFQKLSSTPLLTQQDQEWGLNHRHSNGMRFPKNMTLGAIQDESLLYELGRELGRQAKLVGIFCPLGPVVDVNSNPQNPIIGDRSFGDNPTDVARKSLLLMKGLQDEGVAACAKHFPGHGDTEEDSHTALPKITRTKKELKKCEILPFQKLIDNDVKCVMTAHILVPGLDPRKQIPATFSRPIMTDLLQKEMGFEGVIFTDDMLMKAISALHTPGDAAVQAFQAGCTMILSSKDIPECFQALKELVDSKKVSEKELNNRVRKILQLKKWLQDKNGKLTAKLESTSNYSELFTPKAQALKRRLFEEAVTFLNPKLPQTSTALVQVGGLSTSSTFISRVLEERNFPLYFLQADPTKLERKEVLNQLAAYDSVVVAFCEMNRKAKDNFGIKKETVEFVQEMRKLNKNVIYVFFGSPYALKFFKTNESCLIAYEDDRDAQRAAADILLGHLQPKGKLPIKRPEY
jgi:beta-N-acetylhexosaminidase